MQNRTPSLLTIKVCPPDTTSRIFFGDTGPRNIKQWKEETLNTVQQKGLDVFYIKHPNDYFETFTLKQNIWPMDKANANTVSVSQSFSNERNLYFI